MIAFSRRLAVACLWLLATAAHAQVPTQQLKTMAAAGDITANGDAVTMTGTAGMAFLLIQTTGTHNLTWELQCSGDGSTYDADDEIPVTLISSTPAAIDEVTANAAALYTATIAGCRAVRVIATAYVSGTLRATLTATATAGGGGGGGGGAASAVSITQGGNTAAVNASSQLSVTCANCSGSGVSVLEDAPSASGDAGTPAYSVRNDTLTAGTSLDGDYQPLKSTSGGALYTAPTLQATTDVDALTPATDGAQVNARADPLGRQITVVGCGTHNRIRGQATITDGSSTSIVAAQGANVIAEIYQIEIVNTSATDVSVDIRDGTAGAVLWSLMAPATSDTGGGNNRVFVVPLTFTANTAVAADPSAAASSIIVSALGCSVR